MVHPSAEKKKVDFGVCALRVLLTVVGNERGAVVFEFSHAAVGSVADRAAVFVGGVV